MVTLTSGNSSQTVTLPNPNGGTSPSLSLASGNTSKVFFSNTDLDNQPTPPNGRDPTAVVGMWNEVDTTVSGANGSTVVQNNGTDSSNASVRKEIIYNDQISTVQVDNVTGGFGQMRSPASLIITTPNNSYAYGGTATFANLRFDLPSKRVIADCTNKFYTSLFTTQTKSATAMPAFSYDSISGPTGLSPQALAAASLGDFSLLLDQGYVVVAQPNGTYTASATIVLNNLRITTEGLTLRPDSPSENSTNALDAIQSGDTGWGDVTLQVKFNGTYTPPTTASTGQTASTTRTLPNGVPLRVKVISVGVSEMRYRPLSIDENAPSLTVTGMLAWLNFFGVTPLNLTGDTPSYNDSILDPRFSIDDPFGRGNIRTAIRTRSNGSTVSFNGSTGEILSIGGFKLSEMGAAFMNNAIAGGYWKVDNFQVILTSNRLMGDLSGERWAYGSAAGYTIPVSAAVPLFNFTTRTSGPASIPLAALASAGNISNLSSVLTAAGFTVNSVTASEITFTGTYVLDGVSARSEFKQFACQAWGCAATAAAALNSADSNHVGQFRTPVKLSIPLVP